MTTLLSLLNLTAIEPCITLSIRNKKYGEHLHLVQELLVDVALFEAFFRLTKQQFELLLKAGS